jgi:HSP20 family protein
MDLVRWRPFRRLWDFGDLETIFKPILFEGEDVGFSPAVDLYEEGNTVVVKTELPGINKKDIHLSLDGDRLTIKGKRDRQKEVKRENYYYAERSYGSFSRAIHLPCEVKRDGASASYKDGVLEIRLPKEKGEDSKEIKIH